MTTHAGSAEAWPEAADVHASDRTTQEVPVDAHRTRMEGLVSATSPTLAS